MRKLLLFHCNLSQPRAAESGWRCRYGVGIIRMVWMWWMLSEWCGCDGCYQNGVDVIRMVWMLSEWCGCYQNGVDVMNVIRMVWMWWMLSEWCGCDGCYQNGVDVIDVISMVWMWWMLSEWCGCDGCYQNGVDVMDVCQNVGDVENVTRMLGA